MITPLDIQNMSFAKAVRGYKEEEVDGFLDLLTLDLEKILDENRKLKERVRVLSIDLEKYKDTEGTVLETLEAAKALMNDITASAEKRAQYLLKNAELDAELILRNAKESVEKLNEESLVMQNRLSVFKAKYKLLLESEINRFDTLSVELFGQDTDLLYKLEEASTISDMRSQSGQRTGEGLNPPVV